jgi:hypothetical protein
MGACEDGDAQEEDKDDFLSELAVICLDQSLTFLAEVDFYLLRSSHEKNKELKNSHNDLFNSLINLYDLRKIVMVGEVCTWSNNRRIQLENS